jgi:hypothetical protein
MSRQVKHNLRRTEVDLKKIMSGKGQNVTLEANDILFIPSSSNKKAANKALEAIMATIPGMMIFRPALRRVKRS